MSHQENQDHHHPPKKRKKVHHRVTKYLMEKDTLFATLWVFIFIVLLGSIPLNLGVLNPIKLGLKDFDFNDLSYSNLGKGEDNTRDDRIIVINIGKADREGIAYIIDKVASYKPCVMGLDVTFNGPRDPSKDSLLREVVNRNKNLVLAVKAMTDSTDKLIPGENYFMQGAAAYGFVNFPYEEKEKKTIRTYQAFKYDDKNKNIVLPSFSSTLIKFYDTAGIRYKKIQKKGDKNIIINYTRTTNEKKMQYVYLEGDRVLTEELDSSFIKGKIALIAYVNTSPDDIEDKKFTPMNEKFAGKSTPDMNGIFVHANIISMVLDDNYIKKVPLWVNILIAVLVCWLHMSFFVHYYLEAHIWFHLAAKIAQVASAIFFVWLGIYLFDRYRLKVDLKYSLITIVMAVDVIYFYEAWAVWMHKKFNYKTVFKPHHH